VDSAFRLRDDLWTTGLRKKPLAGDDGNLEQDIRRRLRRTLWQFRTGASKSLWEYARGRLSRELAASGASPEAVDQAKHLFDPNALTLGFCAALRDLQETEPAAARSGSGCFVCWPILSARCNSSSGKAHPEDEAGRR